MKLITSLGAGLLLILALAPCAVAAEAAMADTTASAAATAPATSAAGSDDLLDAARKYVEQHPERYMHHSKLKRGMKGYGLTVAHGTKIERFDVEVVSVTRYWGAHQDMILANLSGLGLEKSGVVAGMSGSPCFFKDADGKDKLVGAVAFGWSFPKEPLCGIQPITQMLAVDGFLAPGKAATRPATAAAADPIDKATMKALLSPAKADFVKLAWSREQAPAAKSGLRPLATPLAICGRSDRARDELGDMLRPLGVVPVQGGGAAAPADVAAAKDAKIEPGGGVSILLVSGDADISGVGTVTEVVGDRVLVFGHQLFASGDVSSFPMGPAYVHTFVSGYMESFKLASRLDPSGSLWMDESTGVSGRVGVKADMLPVTIDLDWKDPPRRQTYRYQVIRHPRFTPLAIRYCITEASSGWKAMPLLHTVRYSVEIDFGKMGVYRTANISSNDDGGDALSDAVRPVMALRMNQFGAPVEPVSVKVSMSVEEGTRDATIISLDLAGSVYRPGELVEGTLTVRPFQKDKTALPVSLRLPADLPDGNYTIDALEASQATQRMALQQPHRFQPRTVPDLFKALQALVEQRADDLYLCLPLPRGGLAMAANELPDLPPSRREIIQAADVPETRQFRDALFRTHKTPYVLQGHASASFTVQREPKKTLLRP